MICSKITSEQSRRVFVFFLGRSLVCLLSVGEHLFKPQPISNEIVTNKFDFGLRMIPRKRNLDHSRFTRFEGVLIKFFC